MICLTFRLIAHTDARKTGIENKHSNRDQSMICLQGECSYRRAEEEEEESQRRSSACPK